MILLVFFDLARAIYIKTGQIDVVRDGKTDDFWTKSQHLGYCKLFFEGVNNDHREFSVFSHSKEEIVQMQVQGHGVGVGLSSHFIDLGLYGMGTVVVDYQCKGKDFHYVDFKIKVTDADGEKTEFDLKWVKMCQEIKTFTGSFIIVSILGIFIVILALFLEKTDTGPNETEKTTISSLLQKNRKIVHSQYLCFVIILVGFYFHPPDLKILNIFLDVLSGLSLIFILKQKILKNSQILNLIFISFGLFLFLLSFFLPNLIIQNIQFACISIFLLQCSKSLPFPMLILLSFLQFFYSILTFESDLYPLLSSSSLVEIYRNQLASFLVIPFSFSTASPFQVSLPVTELYLPGLFLVKLRTASTSQSRFYFTASLFTYLLSTISESLVRTYLNSSSLLIAGPLLSLALIGSSLYRKEFSKVVLEAKEPGLIINEIPMQQISK